MRQPRILVVDAAGPTGLPYARLVARLQPMELRFESSLTKAVDSLSRDAWDLGIVTIRGGQSADALHEAIRGADPRLRTRTRHV